MRATSIERELVKTFADLPDGRRLSFTFDGWTSSNMTPYIAVTAHYVDKDWQLRRHLIAFRNLPGSHTGLNIATLLYNIICEYKIENKVYD